MKKKVVLCVLLVLAVVFNTAASHGKIEDTAEPMASLEKPLSGETPDSPRYVNWLIRDEGSIRFYETLDLVTGERVVTYKLVTPPADICTGKRSTVSSVTISTSQRQALIDLYNSTNGDNWTNNDNWRKPGFPDQFNDPGTENTWKGILLTPDGLHVYRIVLGMNNLTGTLPDLSALTELETLSVYWSNLNGNIPATLNNLSKLKLLNLARNQFTGSIPDLSATSLQWIGMDYNQLTGSIPSGFGNLTNLYSISLNYNRLDGGIPWEFGNLINLHDMNLSGNNLRGAIPYTLSNLVNLYPNNYISFNGLYTSNPGLKDYLDTYMGDWETTQTIAPTDLYVTGITGKSLTLHWTPIPYQDNTGGYMIYYIPATTGYIYYLTTINDKSSSSYTLPDILQPGATYSFMIKSFTDPHSFNQNQVISGYSIGVSATTVSPEITIISPNGGESWQIGSIKTIRWNAIETYGTVKIVLWKDGQQVGRIVNNLDPNSGSYNWVVGENINGTASPGSGYRIRVRETGTPNYDESDASFTLY
jgi:hypothetical protein